MTHDELKAAYQAMQALCTQAADALQENINDLVESSTNPSTGLLDDDVDLLAVESDTDLVARLRAAAVPVMRAQPAPVQGMPFGVGGGLVAIKTLLSRDPCIHANTAIEMIDAILKEHPAAQPAPVQPVAWEHHAKKLTQWLHCMSHNDSYFGEPAGLVKQVTAELNRLMGATPPTQPEPVQKTVAWTDLLKQAEEVVRSKSLWKKYIDGTPLANDIAVWMANFAQEHTTPPAQPAVPLTSEKAREICDRWTDENGNTGSFGRYQIIRDTEAAHGITAAPEKGGDA